MNTRIHCRNHPDGPPRRKGTILVLTAFLMIAMMAFMAFAVDVGYLCSVRTELQRTADSAAIAAAVELFDEPTIASGGNMSAIVDQARLVASEYAAYNRVSSKSPSSIDGDITIGYREDPHNSQSPITFSDPTKANTVSVNVRRSDAVNGEVPFFFARALGFDTTSMNASATAAFETNLTGFQIPSDGQNTDLLPFAMDEETWNDMLAGNADDNWSWDPETQTISGGSDGILEVNLYPQGTGSPGNRGTVDIGSSNNSTNDISRQITDGVSPEDLEYHGGELELDHCGELELNADTGISAGFKDELESIKGDPRVIPIFREINGNGNNAQYTIVCFAGVRIMEVKLTGKMSSKRVIIQPSLVKTVGGKWSDSGTPTSYFVYSPVMLVQ